LDFFREKGHTILPSSSLVPEDDPTLLFTNAGMVQFKDVFLGRRSLPFSRVATVQKCLRVGGKHSDLENVGRTARHHTFFEMLGNFSFGDYFKREAISYAWEYLTERLRLPRERLWATVFREDEEAFSLWQEIAGLPPGRIVRLGEKDNFWAMGDTGPCGPCSELVYDRGEELSCGPGCAVGACECDRWLEVWNLVFMQYERREDGTLLPLPRPSIDTGMGLERIAAVLQGVPSNFETDLFLPLIRAVEEETGRRYSRGEEGFPLRVIADHLRAATFLVTDGILPSNEGRGFVLRRIIRRAVRFGRKLGKDAPFLYRLCRAVAETMEEAYPELRERLPFVEHALRAEEEKFLTTLEQGLARISELFSRLRAEGRQVIPGEEAFLLYDTYGFPLDLTREVAAEEGMAVDEEGFERAMEEQRRRAREDFQRRLEAAGTGETGELPPTVFRGYETLELEATVLSLQVGGRRVREAGAGEEVALVLDATPFYAEAGGQVGDRGEIRGPEGWVEIADTQSRRGIYFHRGRVREGVIREGERVEARVDGRSRLSTARNHTATHLLHKAVKLVLGTHARQAGSLVAPDRLRFDFTHFRPLTREEVKRIEETVNARILEALPVTVEETSLAEARARGAEALFGEKYGERVRMVRVGDFSLELCGGTHVRNSGEIGFFKITAQEGLGAGVRRVEALTGEGFLRWLWSREEKVGELGEMLRAPLEELPGKVRDILEREREQERRLGRLRDKVLKAQGEALLSRARLLGEARVVLGEVEAEDMEDLRRLGDLLRERLGSGAVLLGTRGNGKALFLALLTPDLVARGMHAGRLAREMARVAGGGGGGRPDMAQAGGRFPERLKEALERGFDLLKEELTAG